MALESDGWPDANLAPASTEVPAAPAVVPCATAPPRSSAKTGCIANTGPAIGMTFLTPIKAVQRNPKRSVPSSEVVLAAHPNRTVTPWQPFGTWNYGNSRAVGALDASRQGQQMRTVLLTTVAAAALGALAVQGAAQNNSPSMNKAPAAGQSSEVPETQQNATEYESGRGARSAPTRSEETGGSQPKMRQEGAAKHKPTAGAAGGEMRQERGSAETAAPRNPSEKRTGHGPQCDRKGSRANARKECHPQFTPTNANTRRFGNRACPEHRPC